MRPSAVAFAALLATGCASSADPTGSGTPAPPDELAGDTTCEPAEGAATCGAPPPSTCPDLSATAVGTMEPDLEAAWCVADPAAEVRVEIRLAEQPDPRELGDPTDPGVRDQLREIVDGLQACLLARIAYDCGEVMTTFAEPNSIVATISRPAAYALLAHPDVGEIRAAGPLPPVAGARACADLGQEACGARPDCLYVEGHLYDANKKCVQPAVPLGCVFGTLTGGGEPTWAELGTQCLWFEHQLVPEEFSTELVNCAGLPARPSDCEGPTP